jgi:hypothetical protein
MVTARIFKGDDVIGKPSQEATEPMSFEQARKDLRMWIVGCPDSVLNILLGEGGLFHLEGDGQVCQWHYRNGEVTEYFADGATVLVR